MTGIFLCIGYLSIPTKDSSVIFGVFHLIISTSTLIYFLNMEYSILYNLSKENESKITAIFNSSPDAIVLSNYSGEIISCNNATVDMYKCNSNKDLIGKNVSDFFIPSEERALKVYRDTIFKKGKIKNVLFLGLNMEGGEFPVKVSTAIVKNSNNTDGTLVSITRDISEAFKSEKDLQFSLKEKHILLDEINSRVKKKSYSYILTFRIAVN